MCSVDHEVSQTSPRTLSQDVSLRCRLVRGGVGKVAVPGMKRSGKVRIGRLPYTSTHINRNAGIPEVKTNGRTEPTFRAGTWHEDEETKTETVFNLEGTHYCTLARKQNADGQSEHAEKVALEAYVMKDGFAHEDTIASSWSVRTKTNKDRQGHSKQAWPCCVKQTTFVRHHRQARGGLGGGKMG